MPAISTIPVCSRGPLGPHEELDAYWFAQMLRCRIDRVAADARCASSIRRGLDAALGRAIRFIVEGADGRPEKADARLEHARESVLLALSFVDTMSLKRRIREVVVDDLRGHASLLLQRLKMLEGKPVERWSESNYLPTVLDEVKGETDGDSPVDVVAAVAKLPDAAIRERPEPVVAEHFAAYQPANENGRPGRLADRGKDKSPQRRSKKSSA